MLGNLNHVKMLTLKKLYQKIFQEHFQPVKRFGSKSVGPDLGPNCLKEYQWTTKIRKMLSMSNQSHRCIDLYIWLNFGVYILLRYRLIFDVYHRLTT